MIVLTVSDGAAGEERGGGGGVSLEKSGRNRPRPAQTSQAYAQ